MSGLRFFARRTEHGGRLSSFPVHVADPDRMPHFSMCGVALSNMSERSDPRTGQHGRPCDRCDGWRELAEERASRRDGIAGGWEVCGLDQIDMWHARDSLGRAWIVSRITRAKSTDNTRTYVATCDGQIVRRVGHNRRTTWRTDAQAMRACEDLARNGDYVLDRPKRVAS